MAATRSALALLLPCVLAAAGLTPEQARSDYDLLRKALEEAHSGLNRFTPKAETDSLFAATRAKLTREMSQAEFRAEVAATLARIRCGHTGVQNDDVRETLPQRGMFPLSLSVEARKLVVASNDTSSDHTIRPGMEILKINGRDAAGIVDRMLRFVTADGDIETGRFFRIGRNFALNYWLYIEPVDHFEILARAPSGETRSVKLDGIRSGERRENAEANPVNAEVTAGRRKIEWARENLSLRFLKDPEIAEIRIGGFGGDGYPQWIENTFKTLRDKGSKALILDLRGNGGGRDQYGAILVSYLTHQPFRYFDHINMKTIEPSFKEHTDWQPEDAARFRQGTVPNPAGGFLVTPDLHPPLAEQQPGKYSFAGKVFVLIDGGSFSTTADFCAIAHYLKLAKFIGEETGGGYYGNNSGAQVVLTLPHSGLRVRVPMWEYWNAVSGQDRRRGTRPDHEVHARVADTLRGADPALDLALGLAAR